ncbi:serine hydrolase [uncultured Kordia sp.]|uniref:serine hydrolase domain-containing protein n=1 Tax=uncultured Kordia sp. TaxID=507699 RepID=UPI0026174470|nr:serine hydrolase domain-containing protein [uncultured Kordia sp.]
MSFSIGMAQKPVLSQKKFNELISEATQNHMIPGMAAIVVNSDSILNSAVSGERKLLGNDKITLNDRFHIGSLTKAFTATIAGKLVEEGKINWDTRFFDVFPEIEQFSKEDYCNITLNELLSHRAGLKPYTEDPEWDAIPAYKSKSKAKRRLEFAIDVLNFPPVNPDLESGYVYSNAGYSLAASMLEKVSGKGWEALLQEYIFIPLHMKASSGWPGNFNAAQPWGHWLVKENTYLTIQEPDGKYQFAEVLQPAGDLNMSIIDYGKFLQANLKGLHGSDNIVTAATYNYIHYANIDFSSYSIGWSSRQKDEETFSIHSGSAGTFDSCVLLVKELDIAIAIFVNAYAPEVEKVVRKLRNDILKVYLNQ